VTKSEGYRFYLTLYIPSLSHLDDMETGGDSDTDNKPGGPPIVVQPFSEVKRYYELRKQMMADPESFKPKPEDVPDDPKPSVAEGGDPEGVGGGKEDDLDEEMLGGNTKVLFSDLSNMLVGCFEGPAKAQRIFSKVVEMTRVIGEVPPECRLMFTKNSDPMEVSPTSTCNPCHAI